MTEADPPQMVNRLARDVLGTGGRGDTEEAYPMTKSHITSGFAAAMMAVAAAALPSAPALADIQFFTGPGSVQPDENVLLNKDTTGMTVFGDTNQSGLSVTFEGMEDLTLPAAGQARIEAVDGGFELQIGRALCRARMGQ